MFIYGISSCYQSHLHWKPCVYSDRDVKPPKLILSVDNNELTSSSSAEAVVTSGVPSADRCYIISSLTHSSLR